MTGIWYFSLNVLKWDSLIIEVKSLIVYMGNIKNSLTPSRPTTD